MSTSELSAHNSTTREQIEPMSASINNDNKEENVLTSPHENGDLVVTNNKKVQSLTLDINGSNDFSPIIQHVVPPDGGWGWVIVFSALSITTIIGGSYIGFAILYIEFVEAFHASRLAAGWIGSLAIGCGNMLGIFFGGSVRRYGSQKICIIGALVTVLGYFLSAFSTDIVHLYLSCGILAGIGVSMMVVSSLVIVQQYFNKRRPIAVAIAVFGYSLGTLLGGPVIQLFLDLYAWRGTLILISGIFLQVVVFACLFRPPVPIQSSMTKSEKQKELSKIENIDLQVTTRSKSSNCSGNLKQFLRGTVHSFGFILLVDPSFLLYILSCFILHLGVTVFLQHTPSRAVYVGVERHHAVLLPTMIGATTGITRLIFGFVANIPGVNRLLQYSISIIVSGIIQATTSFARTFEVIAAFVILESIANGGFFCIMSTIIVDIKGIENVARSQALLSFSCGLGILISTPFAGYLFDVTQNYDIPFIVTGCISILGGFLGLVAHWLKWLKKPEVP